MPASQRLYVDVAARFNSALEQYGEFHRSVIVHMIVETATAFKADNPQFDRDRFYRAAGVPHLCMN